MAKRTGVTKFGLRNFKSFYYLEDIDIRPLTVLVGTNSSGKSSLLQSLLLLKQTSRDERFSGMLKFDGEWTQLGSFANVISNFDLERTLEYRFTVEFEVSGEDITQLFPDDQFTEDATSQPASVISEIRICFAVHPDTKYVTLEEMTIATRIPALMTAEQTIVLTIGRNSTAQNLPLPSLTGWQPPEFSVAIDKFWPTNVSYRIEQSDVAEQQHKLRLSYDSKPPALFVSLGILRETLEDLLEYIGPIRSDPRPFYPVEETHDIGSRGEATIPYLLHHQSDVVDYAPSLSDDVREVTLLEAINYWLQRMDITTRLTIEPIESVAYIATIHSPSASAKSVNLAQVGFGVSQLLPVLVMGLKNPSNGWLLLEQPEIHLHPRLQGELAEFLLCAARTGKTIIVETHSDHLINRLRRCIAEDETGALSELVSILFVHPGTPDNPSSYVEPLEIDESGAIVNWPPDFLSDSANEALAIMRAAQRKAHAIRT